MPSAYSAETLERARTTPLLLHLHRQCHQQLAPRRRPGQWPFTNGSQDTEVVCSNQHTRSARHPPKNAQPSPRDTKPGVRLGRHRHAGKTHTPRAAAKHVILDAVKGMASRARDAESFTLRCAMLSQWRWARCHLRQIDELKLTSSCL